ncbi:hypothetical protein [Cryptosporangium japonicum]|uniref:hypothetical protein n=1 Tax=Cryptosporangium japonicum TaxID=80872 RepID=UPI0031E0C614
MATLVGAALAFQDVRPLAPILYFTGWALTLPIGVLIYPALWVNSFVAGLAPTDEWSTRIGTCGVLAIFVAAASVNALVGRACLPRRRHRL